MRPEAALQGEDADGRHTDQQASAEAQSRPARAEGYRTTLARALDDLALSTEASAVEQEDPDLPEPAIFTLRSGARYLKDAILGDAP